MHSRVGSSIALATLLAACTRLGPRSADLVLYAGIGGKLIGVAVVGGLIATIGMVLERTRR